MSKNIAVFASGTGSNFIKIYKATIAGEIKAKLNFFFSDKANSRSLSKALELGLNTLSLSLKDFPNKRAYEEKLIEALDKYDIDLIVLAGYMKIIGADLLAKFPKRIINIHPSLLPKYRGKDALIRQHANQEENVGITIHYVDQGIDTGEIIFQKQVKIQYPTELEQLEDLIHSLEHRYYKDIISQVLEEMK